MDMGHHFDGTYARDFASEGSHVTLGSNDSADALEALLADHQDLVLETAARYAPAGVDPAELVQAGIEGLLDAAARFDESCGAFASFAAWWVRKRVMRKAAALAA